MKVQKVKKKYTPWMVDVPKKITGSRRVRKFFATRDDGEAFLVRVRMLGFAAADGSELGEKDVRGMRVAEATAIFRSRSEDRLPSTRSQLKYILGSLDGRFGARRIDSVTHLELDDWFRDLKMSFTSRWNYYRVTRRFFKWCHEFLEVIPRSPFAKVPKPVKGHEEQACGIAILLPAQMKRALRMAGKIPEPDRSRLIADLCLGGFAGIRTNEALHAQWSDLDFKAGEIYVRQPKRVRGWRPRYVKMLPAFVRHVASLVPEKPVDRGKDSQGKFTASSKKVLPGGNKGLYDRRRRLMQLLRWKSWPVNCLRHSFGTYHLAEFRDLAALRGEMGHETEDVTRARYALPAKKAQAAAWWNL